MMPFIGRYLNRILIYITYEGYFNITVNKYDDITPHIHEYIIQNSIFHSFWCFVSIIDNVIFIRMNDIWMLNLLK